MTSDESPAQPGRASEADLDYEALFSAAPEAALVVAADDTIVEINEALTEWTGLDRQQLVGTKFSRLLSIGDRILLATRTTPLLDLTGRVPQIAVTVLGRDRVAYPANLVAARVAGRNPVTLFQLAPRREQSFEEAELLSAVHRAEDSDARRREAEEDLRRLALQDPLTGLLNRHGLLEALSEAIPLTRPSDEVVVLWFGLDHFRVINDSLGRTAGDHILTSVASRLRAHYDEQWLLARVSGDEFVVASATVPASTLLSAQAENLLQLIVEPMLVDDLEIVVSASAGVARREDEETNQAPAVAVTADTLLRSAGMGMYEAKAAGRARWKRSETTDDNTVVHEIRLLGEMRAAIEADQFRLDYQPQLDLRTGRVYGLEALIRWDHPTRGVVPPLDFIQTAERSGLISALGLWTARTAISRAVELGRASNTHPLQMSINVSARQLGDTRFADDISALLHAAGLQPALLTLELTETGLITDAPQTRDTLDRLHQLGARLSIDDFGTGHAGFAYLEEFPIDEIKIDRSFIDKLDVSPEATAIVVSCIELAHALGVTVVAEGIETAAQLERLTELNCDIIQGFHYSRPLHTTKLSPWLAGAPVR